MSTGVKPQVRWARMNPNAPMTRYEAFSSSGFLEHRPVDKLIRDAPLGSKIAWCNIDPQVKNTDWEHENAIKMGPDYYCAHPFGCFSGKEVERHLAEASRVSGSKDAGYIKKNIFVCDIEKFNTP